MTPRWLAVAAVFALAAIVVVLTLRRRRRRYVASVRIVDPADSTTVDSEGAVLERLAP